MEKNHDHAIPRTAVVLANGNYPTASLPLQLLHTASYIVCCDGAANQLVAHGLTPHAIVGDGDSIAPRLREQYAHILHTSPCQETNDLTKAILHVAAQGIRHVSILGATGAREDHTIGNISLLLLYMHQHMDVRLFTDHGIFVPCQYTTTHQCQPGQQVSIFACGATGLQATGLRYPLYDFTAWWQGTLNECTSTQFTVKAQGDYIVFIAYPEVS